VEENDQVVLDYLTEAAPVVVIKYEQILEF
jgi:hypothetical protein